MDNTKLSDETSIIFPAIFENALTTWTDISAFSEIDVSSDKKTIVFCDIDNTVLHHPFTNPSWSQLIKMCFYMRNIRTHDRKRANMEYEAYFDQVLTSQPIQHTDFVGFCELADRVEKLVFVTARQPETLQFTRQNLACVGIDPARFEIHFSNAEEKGKYITRVFDLSGYDSVVFIDDLTHNLESVFNHVKHAGLQTYRFVRECDPYTYYPFPPGFLNNVRFNGEDLEPVNG
jgi:hypothetical protein